MWESLAVAAARSSWAFWVWGAMFVVALVMAVAAWYWFSRRLRRAAEQVLRVVITNRGNVRSRYEVRAESPDDALRLAFAAEGETLIPKAGEEWRGLWKRGRSRVEKGMRAGSSAAGVLNAAGNLLPGSLGRPLSAASGEIRQGQSAVRRVERTPRRVAQLQTQVARHKRGGKKESPQPLLPQTETGYLAPGESLTLRLLALPTRRDESRTCAVVVRSRSLEQKGGEWLVTEAQVSVVGLTPLQRYGPYLAGLAAALAILFVSSLLCSWWGR